MLWKRILLAPLVLAFLAPSAPAGLFSRKPKSNPAERVPELLIQLKAGPDEDQRAAAAEELRQFDPKAFPEITTGLIDALSRDTSAAVRAEAASSLGKLRPISQNAGYALEQAQTNDGSMRVRLAARQAVWQYHLVGYRSGKPQDSAPPSGSADASVSAPPAMQRQTNPRGTPPSHGLVRETAEPPLATSNAVPVMSTPTSRPRTANPAPAQLIPSNPPRLKPVPQQTNPNSLAPVMPIQPAPDNGPALPPPA